MNNLKNVLLKFSKKINLAIVFVSYTVLYIFQNTIKEKFNVDISFLLKNEKILTLFVSSYFLLHLLQKENRKEVDDGMLILFSIVLSLVVGFCLFSTLPNDSPYEKCIDRFYSKQADEIEKICSHLSKQ